MNGTLVGIARASELRAPMRELREVSISVEKGIAGDARGAKRNRQVTVLFRDGWEDACKEAHAELPWTSRRANLLLADVQWPREAGGLLCIGEVELQVTMETAPCHLMDHAYHGLRKALRPDWRGGVCCKVIKGGNLQIGDRARYIPQNRLSATR